MVSMVLAWLEHGSPDHDDRFLASGTSGLRAMVTAWGA
jgi:hypothetical protein